MFGARLRLLREERQMSQLELSKSLGIGNVTLSQYENGARKPDNDTLVKISNYFDVSTDYLLGKTEWKKPPSLTQKDERDIQRELEQMVSDLNSGQDGPAFYGGNMELSEYDREVLTRSLDDILHLIKLRNKEKYTPKKYRERDEYSL